MTRAFLGIALPRETATTLAERARDALGPAARELRLCKSADLHLTLFFVGRAGERTLARIATSMAQASLAAPRLVIDHTGAFPTRQKPRVLWAAPSGAQAELGRLVVLAQAAESFARDAGVDGAREEAFRPHVTLARAKDRRRADAAGNLDAFFDLELALPWEPDALALFASDSTPGAAVRYPVLARVSLVREAS